MRIKVKNLMETRINQTILLQVTNITLLLINYKLYMEKKLSPNSDHLKKDFEKQTLNNFAALNFR